MQHHATQDDSQVRQCTPAIRARDGYELAYRTWAGHSPTGTVILLSGVMSHALWFQPLAEPLARSGFHVVGADRRGSGLNRRGRGDAPSPEVLLDDLRRIIEREHLPDRPLYLLGWCWGAVLAVNAALELGRSLDGLILLAPGLFPSRVIKGRMAEQHGLLATRDMDDACLASPISEEMFTDGHFLDEFILKDERRLTCFTPRFYRAMFKLGAIAIARLAELTQPILLVLAERDDAVDNPHTLRVFEQLNDVPVTIATCDSRHGMQFETPVELATHITSWFESRGKS